MLAGILCRSVLCFAGVIFAMADFHFFKRFSLQKNVRIYFWTFKCTPSFRSRSSFPAKTLKTSYFIITLWFYLLSKSLVMFWLHNVCPPTLSYHLRGTMFCSWQFFLILMDFTSSSTHKLIHDIPKERRKLFQRHLFFISGVLPLHVSLDPFRFSVECIFQTLPSRLLKVSLTTIKCEKLSPPLFHNQHHPSQMSFISFSLNIAMSPEEPFFFLF